MKLVSIVAIIALTIMVIGISSPFTVSHMHAQEVTPPTLSSELMLRVQVQQLIEQLHNIEIGLAQCNASKSEIQARLDSALLNVQASDLNSKHAKLDDEIKKALGGKPDDTVDWTTSPPSLVKKPLKP